jgi:4a-hydroxytetrahydrobiopterin dehydratase
MITRESLLKEACRHLTQASSADEIAAALVVLSDWAIDDGKLVRMFRFSDYHQTLTFVNAIAEIIHKEDHHPELIVGYNRCEVRYDTHSVNEGKGGLSANDFICAAKIDAVFERGVQ